MTFAEYFSCDGVALAKLVRKRMVSSKELVLLFVEADEKVNPGINAILEVYYDPIEGLDDRPIVTSRFAGVPFLMKDIGATENVRHQECGSRLMKGHVADKYSFLTELLKGADLSLLSRTTTTEFALDLSKVYLRRSDSQFLES